MSSVSTIVLSGTVPVYHLHCGGLSSTPAHCVSGDHISFFKLVFASVMSDGLFLVFDAF